MKQVSISTSNIYPTKGFTYLQGKGNKNTVTLHLFYLINNITHIKQFLFSVFYEMAILKFEFILDQGIKTGLVRLLETFFLD